MAKLSKHIQNKKKDREKKRAKKLKNRRVSAIGKHKLDTVSALKNEINNDLEISKNVRSQTKLTKHNRNIKIPINVDHRTEQTQPKNKYDGEVSMYLSTSEKNYTLMEATNLAEKPSGSFDLVKKALGATIDANRVTDVEKSKRPKKNNRWKKLKAELQEKKKKREDLKKKIDNVSYNQGHSSHAIGDLTDDYTASDFKTLIPNEAKTISQRQEKKREWRRQMKRLQKLKLKWAKEGQTDIEALVSEWRHKKRDSLNSDGGDTKGSRLLRTTEDSTHPDAVSKKQTNDAVTGIKDHTPSEKICAGEKMQAIKKINLPKSDSDEAHSDNNNDISQSEPDYKDNSAFERNIAQLKKVGEMNKQSMSRTSEVTNKALQRLRVAQFRIINESLYTLKSDEARKLFENDPSAFQIYHDGYRSQVCHNIAYYELYAKIKTILEQIFNRDTERKWELVRADEHLRCMKYRFKSIFLQCLKAFHPLTDQLFWTDVISSKLKLCYIYIKKL